jgi:MYXO-CTERM domain-containing protein
MLRIRYLLPLTLALTAVAASPARARDVYVNRCEAIVDLHIVTYHVEICDNDAEASSNVPVRIWYNRATAPGLGEAGDETLSLSPNGGCAATSWFDLDVPNGKYHLWCRAMVDPDASPANNTSGPNKYVVGPDLWIHAFWVVKDGDTTNYYARVCNIGTDAAGKFRVGFYYDRSTPPADGEYSNGFKSLESLPPAYYYWWNYGFAPWLCKEVLHKRTPTPDGIYQSYAKVDEGLFVDEAEEGNNVAGPLFINMANADLVIESFSASVSQTTPYRLEYKVRVCNRGKATASKFWIDLYYDRAEDDPPMLGQPGEDHRVVLSLPPEACVDEVFEILDAAQTSAENPEYQSWVQADSDEFVYDPDRSTNIEGPLDITVPGGVVTSGCVDNDGDGVGVGTDCPGQQDCNDMDATIKPGAPEICGDGIDQNCNETPDDGCPGVDCQDLDGDGWPSGPDCVVADCDDANPQRYPGAKEICGDNIDQDCDGIPDDCCPGSTCCDRDNDGYGVGAGCPGQQDCNDDNPAAGSPDAPERCGDNVDNDCDGLIDENCPGTYCEDADDDGYGVGVGCTGPQDPDDSDPTIHPGAVEICGDGIDQDGNGIPDDGCNTCVDTDGDGYYVGDGDDPNCQDRPKDCNDRDGSIHPGAQEACDLVDNDCDHTVDDGTPAAPCPDPACVIGCNGNAACIASCPGLNCLDADGDGWGAGPGCQIPDCNDSDASISPGQRELCDGIDNDCDQTADDGTPEAPCPQHDCVVGCAGNQACIAECPIVDCLDHDGDGWGVGPDCVVEDPDDSDPATYPGAPEICGDGIDQSGDGVPDEGCVVCVDHDGDGFGVGPYCAVRDCNDDDPTIYPGAPESCGGGDRNCDGVKPISSACVEDCNCASGGSPRGQAPAALGLLVALALLLRRRRR